MTPAMIIKIAIDFLMTVCMIVAMAVQVTGVYAHELLGVALFALFFVHNYLNRRWYGSVLKENRSIKQFISKVINISLVAVMLVLFASGIMISQHVFSFMSFGGSIFARQVHVAAAYWGYMLVSIHLGMHWLMFVNMLHNKAGLDKVRIANFVFMRIAPISIFLYGIYASFGRQVGEKLFAPSPFSLLDHDESASSALIDYLMIMGMYVFITHYLMKVLAKWQGNIKNKATIEAVDETNKNTSNTAIKG